jgi:penicillin-binding protein 2
MNDSDQRSKIFTRRAFVVGAFQGVALAVLGGRLAWLQLAEGGRYKTLSDKNRINTKMVAPSRGEILDRFGVPLAINNQNFGAYVIPEQTDDIAQSLRKLGRLIDLDDYRIQRLIEESKKMSSFVPLEVVDNLGWDDVAKVEVNLSDLPGISINEGEIRNYPFGVSTGHLVGYVGAVSQSDLERDIKKGNLTVDPMLKLPGFRIGKTGIEKSFDSPLRGKAGNKQMEVNVRGREVRELDEEKSTNGKRIALSIDAELQRYCQERLAQHKSASVVVMDAKTGAVYALASHPGFDPNLFTDGISHEDYQELANNPAFPFNNKAISGQYPPGSTFKMMTALAALENGFATSSTSVNCSGRFQLGKDKFHCWKLSGHGNTNVVTAMMKSCDTWFYQLSAEVGIENIANMSRRFGLGDKFGFELKEERSGLIPTKSWLKKRYDKVWRPGETIVSSIGQGYILATPLQLAVMTSRLVNGGKAVKPWLVGYLNDKKMFPDKWPSMGISKSALNLIKIGMDGVVNNEDGTAYASRIMDVGMEMGGKTGTAQVKKINRADRALGIMNEDLEWKYRHHALFVGYAPIHNPRYVVSVVVEHGGGGSAVAAPVAKDIMVEVQKRDPASTNIKFSNVLEKRKLKEKSKIHV